MLKTEYEDAIRLIADVAEKTAALAGVGAMEIAGQIISCMVADPKFMRQFFECPSEAMLSDRFDARCNGALSYHAINGTIVDPKLVAEQRRPNKARHP